MMRLKFNQVTAICAVLFSLNAAVLQAACVYLRALAPGEVRATKNGASWATAYDDVATAVANSHGTSIFAAKGVYVIPNTINVSLFTKIYGGFAGVSEKETIETRKYDENQTIFTGDQALDDTWAHVVPNDNGYTASETWLTGHVIVDGRISPPPAYTGDHDCYRPLLYSTNTGVDVFVSSGEGEGLVIDGVWFTGFSGRSMVKATAGDMTIANCRFVGNKATGDACICFASPLPASGSISNTKFLWQQGANGTTAVKHNSRANLTISGCTFESCYRSGVHKDGNVLQVKDSTVLQNCVFTRNVDFPKNESYEDGVGNISNSAGDNCNPAFINCDFLNNFSASLAACGDPLISRARLIRGGLIANNRCVVNPAVGCGYSLIGYNGTNARLDPLACEGVVFRDNAVVAAETAARSGSYYLGMIGQNNVTADIDKPSKGQPFSVVNCVFDSNTAAATHFPVKGVTPRLCRGPYSLGTDPLARSGLGVANCTFTGPFTEGVYDVAQYGEGYNYDINLVNNIFTVTDADTVNWVYADTPARIKAIYCTVKNLQSLPANIGSCTLLQTDDVPLNAAYVPQAKTPGLRSAITVYHYAAESATATPTYVFGGTSAPLVPQIGALTGAIVPIKDLNDTARPANSFTRGAVQTLSSTAENGVTLTLRRSPLALGSFDSPSAQSVSRGAAITPVTAVPVEEYLSFTGWYRENGALYSSDNPLAISSLTSDLVLTARFSAPTVTLTFDLGNYGEFVSNGSSSIPVTAAMLDSFPAIPAFRLKDGYVLQDWGDLPAQVPSTNATYTAVCKAAAVRIVHVTPEGAGNRDGTDWANAYSDFEEAYADAALFRGEVWMKRGVYTVADAISLRANVTVRGGFDGTETSADDADPEENPVIFTGDLNGDDFWLVNDAAPASELRVPVLSDGVVNPPNPEGTDNFWNPGGNIADNADYGFVHADKNVTNVLFSGVTIASFRTAAFKTETQNGFGIRFEQCRFVANNGAKSSEIGSVDVIDTEVEFDRTSFEGNYWAVNVTSDDSYNPQSCRFTDCAFTGNLTGLKGAALYVQNYMGVDVERCRFFRNAGNAAANNYYNASCLCIYVGYRPNRFADCVFEDNRCVGCGYGAIMLFHPQTYEDVDVFERCKFIGNTQSFTSSPNVASAVFVTYNSGSNYSYLIKDCYFAGNTLDTGAQTPTTYGTILSANNGKWTFLNCTFDGNRFNAEKEEAKGATFNCRGYSRVSLVNSAVINSVLTGAGTVADFRSEPDNTNGTWVVSKYLWGGLTFINTAVGNSASGYKPLFLEAAADPDKQVPRNICLASSVIGGLDTVSLPDPTTYTYRYNVNPDAVPYFKIKAETGTNGVIARALSPNSPQAHSGLKLWLDQGDVYFKDVAANEEHPWRQAAEPRSFEETMPTLDETSPMITDAFGMVRNAKYFGMGPLNVGPLATSLIFR